MVKFLMIKPAKKYLNWEGDRDEAEIERKLDLLRAYRKPHRRIGCLLALRPATANR